MNVRFQEIKAAGAPILIGGDLNAAPWSAATQSIASATGTQILPQWRGTWLLPPLPNSWVTVAGLPIDNILSGGLTLQSAKTLPAMGSDHRPLIIEFTIPSEAEPEGSSGEIPAT